MFNDNGNGNIILTAKLYIDEIKFNTSAIWQYGPKNLYRVWMIITLINLL